ncbi:MAG: hypothetical protein JWN04_3494 [Myxococcaceae bacterium]|nr:hypothetical protein [Myxococcaceae bacterium]
MSAGPYASLNLGRTVGDDPASVAENQRRFAEHVGYAVETLYEVQQVHGGRVEQARAELDPQAFRALPADALISDRCALAIKVADCVAVLLADPQTGAVAAAHAGWRGVVAETVPATVQALVEAYGSRPGELVAAVFPCISRAAFEVQDEVAQQIAGAVGSSGVVQRGAPRPHVDLALAVSLQLAHAGLSAARIDRVTGCTFGDPARFFSFRRDHGVTGRHLAVIMARC